MKTKLLPLLLLAFATTAFAEDKPEFIDNKDGTITHTPSGLVWQKCLVGQTWQAGSNFEGLTNSCSGTATTQSYDDALKLTSDFAGQTDWRIPNIRELRSLVDFDKVEPAINKTLFPKTPCDGWFWSNSGVANSPNRWIVDFCYGVDKIDHVDVSSNYITRLVRGRQFFSLDTPTTDFLNNKDGTVTHTKTGLTWQRCAVGQTWEVEESACQGTVKTFSHADAKKLTSNLAGKMDWRLPTAKELETITDYTVTSPAINTTVFPDTPNIRFWTSSHYETVVTDKNTFFLSFEDSSLYTAFATEKYGVRLVRGASATTTNSTVAKGNVDLVSTLSANPSPAKKGGDLTYTATIANKGTATATGTTLTFYVAPRFMSYSTASSGCELKSSGLSVVCNVGDLAAGGSTTKTMTVNLKKAGGISSSVLVKANEKDANPVDNIGRAATGVKK
jgi:hypothetical protein